MAYRIFGKSKRNYSLKTSFPKLLEMIFLLSIKSCLEQVALNYWAAICRIYILYLMR